MDLLDVNVLVYAHREDAPNHTAYRRWLEDLLGGGDLDYNDIFFDVQGVSVVPEPFTMALLGSGLLGIGGVRLRRRRAQKADL